jgi:uncharacterized DUF497 family protein
LRFTWDRAKAAANARKHGVTFEEAVTSFADPLLGMSGRGRLLLVAHADRGDEIRLISARPAAPRERKDYEKGTR